MIAHKNLLKILYCSRRFWLCNIAGWLAIDLAQSIIDAFDGNAIGANFLNYLSHIVAGMIAGFCVHLAYSKLQWQKQHPINLIPTACVVAIAFGGASTLIHLFDSVPALAETCARGYPRTPDFKCGKVASFFTHNVFAMLAWVMCYGLIQAERLTPQGLRPSRLDTIKAAIALAWTISFCNILNIVGWTADDSYLFSMLYLIGQAIPIVTAVIFSGYTLLIKPEHHIWGSRLLPWVPSLWVMTFCCAALSLEFDAFFWRLYYLETGEDASLLALVHYVLLSATHGNWVSKGQFGGALQLYFTVNFLVMLFWLNCRFSIAYNLKSLHSINSFDLKKCLIFWSGNVGFWLFLGALIYATDLMGLAGAGKELPLISACAFSAAGAFIGAVLHSQVVYLVAKKTAAIYFGLKVFVLSLLMGAGLTSSLWLCNFAYVFLLLDGNALQIYMDLVANPDYLLATAIVSFVSCGLWSLMCYVKESQRLQRDTTIQQLQLEMSMKEIQLNALAGKVDPHFIFNALNNIRALVDEDSEKARAALVVLSDILRSPITRSSQDKIGIAEEMLLVKNYVTLSKIQFEDLLIYAEDISVEVHGALVPAMILQILVENAIKHGISQLPDGGILSLKIYKHEHQLVCKITNNGNLQARSAAAGFGVGVKTVQQRLALLYGSKASFSLHEEQDVVVAQLMLPFESVI